MYKKVQTVYLKCDVIGRFFILTKIALKGIKYNGILHHFNVRLDTFPIFSLGLYLLKKKSVDHKTEF